MHASHFRKDENGESDEEAITPTRSSTHRRSTTTPRLPSFERSGSPQGQRIGFISGEREDWEILPLPSGRFVELVDESLKLNPLLRDAARRNVGPPTKFTAAEMAVVLAVRRPFYQHLMDKLPSMFPTPG